VLPTSKTVRKLRRQAPASRGRSVLRSEGSEHAGEALRPIGPERLRELREAIRNGTYPNEADVLGGLQRLLDVD
jgi:anti-sigma28 factor (negative regulator of flagellin synthesis)